MAERNRPIGVFDSGVGGLTVVKELLRRLPDEDLVYLGDTARVPYGTKSQTTIIKFSLENVEWLLRAHVKLIVIACHTASSWALPTLKEYFRVPFVGVIGPGVRAAVMQTRNQRIGLIGTASTIRSRAYEAEIAQCSGVVKLFTQSCPLFVPFVEEGLIRDRALTLVAQRYLQPLARQRVDTVILGCTHYPLLKPILRRVLGARTTLVDSARETARAVEGVLDGCLLRRPHRRRPHHRYVVTDEPQRFRRMGRLFLGRDLSPVELLR